MIQFNIITIFPEVFDGYFNSSILRRAQKNKLIKIKIINPRDFARDKHKTVDDKPFGGGPGMVLKAEPVLRALAKSDLASSKVVLLSPRGKQFNQAMAKRWAKNHKNIVLISGHYEGIDERVKKITKAEEISIGPYVLTGGELPAMIIVDSTARHIPGVLGREESLEESRKSDFREGSPTSYPVYTRPEVLEHKGKKYRVPKVLLSGNHKKIQQWRKTK